MGVKKLQVKCINDVRKQRNTNVTLECKVMKIITGIVEIEHKKIKFERGGFKTPDKY